VAFWSRKEAVPAMAAANGARRMTGVEQHEWRASTWQAQAAPAPLPMPEPHEDLVLTAEMAEPEPVIVAAPEPVVEPEPEPEPVVVAPEPVIEPVERTDDTGRSQFFCGRGVRLKADVSGCDVFRVEGEFEGQVTARRMFIVPTGVFRGTGTVEEAEVEGRIEGTLVVIGMLTLRTGGRVAGNVRYGEIEIERGGHLYGDVAAKPVPQGASEKPAPAALRMPPERVSAPKPTVVSPAPRPALPPLSFGVKQAPN
jgi:cytoskeletal protein CcmA (bactofilin family)